MINNELLSIYRAAINAVKPNNLIANAVQIGHDGVLKVFEHHHDKIHNIPLQNRDVYVFGAGKAVLGMCEEFLLQIDRFNTNQIKSNQINVNGGRLNIPIGSAVYSSHIFSKYSVNYQFCARNNIPDADSCKSTENVLKLLKQTKQSTRNPLVVGFISGGGSALLALPKQGISIEDKRSVINNLVLNGADIVELNAVRSCLSQVKHGKLALKIVNDFQCQLVTFIISDIINDPIEFIASGPTVLTKTNSLSEKALSIVRKYNINLEDRIVQTINDETKFDFDNFKSNQLENIIIGNNSIALNAATTIAKNQLNFKIVDVCTNLSDEVDNAVEQLLNNVLHYEINNEDRSNFDGICWLAGGEITVQMKNASNIGLGGRCQEMGLRFLYKLHQKSSSLNVQALFAGTDGQDGPTPAAGVTIQYPIISDDAFWNELQQSIQNHDSYNFYQRYLSQSLIEIGPTGTNVMDIYCILIKF